MNKREYDTLIARYARKVRREAETREEESKSSMLDTEDHMIEAAKLHVGPSNYWEPAEQAQALFDHCKFGEEDIPANWRDYPQVAQEPLKANLAYVTDVVVRMDVLDELGVEI
jgi:hypothetical protein